MKLRRMTMADYAEAGVVPPPSFFGYRPGSVFAASQRRYEAGEKRPVVVQR